MSEFIRVAEVATILPGHGRTVHVKGREFALWNMDGQFYCIDDQCPHRGGPLGAGCLQGGEVFCPLHGWGFDLRTGACTTRPDRPVATYPVRIANGWVEICI
jgi:NAD(P)H-dependent nitrite reductase small subunit